MNELLDKRLVDEAIDAWREIAVYFGTETWLATHPQGARR
jgi:hypothetical protein